MKKLNLFIAILLFPYSLLLAQEGTITYTEVIKLDIKLPEGIQVDLPTEKTTEKILTFTPEESVYSTLPEVNQPPAATTSGNVSISFVSGSNSKTSLYKNLVTGDRLEQKSFMGRTFLIEGAILNYNWKVLGDIKTIAGYRVQKAMSVTKKDTLVAWFTPEIPVSNGPENVGKLPGMVLELDLNDGKRTISATKVTLGNMGDVPLERPKKGKKVTQEEYEAIRAEKLEEMKEMKSGGGSTFIISNN